MVEVNMSISQGVNKVARLNGQIKKYISGDAIEGTLLDQTGIKYDKNALAIP